MNILLMLALITFGIIYMFEPIIGRTLSTDHTLCKPKKILSIFNFYKEIFFQIQTEDRTEIWKVNDTDVKYEENQQIIPRLHYNRSHLAKHFQQSLEYETKFNLSRRVVANFQEFEQIIVECMEAQNNTTPLPQTPGCKEAMEMTDTSFNHFACFYGYSGVSDDQRVLVLKYSTRNETLSAIQDQILSVRLTDRCISLRNGSQNTWPTPILVGAMLWSTINDTSNEKYWKYMSLTKETLDSQKIKFLIWDAEWNRTLAYITYWTADQLYYIFRYNEFNSIMTCPHDCYLNTSLTRIHLYSPTGDVKVTYEQTNITISQLFRCEEWQEFEPNLFCEQNQRFDVVLSLGRDNYFQKIGNFWRFNRLGFTRRAIIPDFTKNITNIRFDSDFEAFLVNEGFDTSAPIHGFTFKSRVQDLCKENDEICRQRHFNSSHHYKTCLYGYKHIPIKSYRFKYEIEAKHKSFQYTPSGLKHWIHNKIEEETHRFCTNVWISIRVTVNETGFNGTNELIGVTSGYTTVDISGKNNKIFFVVRDQSTNDIICVRMSFPKNSILDMNFGTEYYVSIRPKKMYQIRSLFFYNYDVFGYGLQANGELFVMNQKDMTFTQTQETIVSLFNCPFNQSYSVVTAYTEEACPQHRVHNKSIGRESVFTLGHSYYHQIGQHFYLFDRNKTEFFYDKYVSDLLSTYFDTRHRVTAYTIYTTFSVHLIAIHGKSHYNLRQLGKYIFAAFELELGTESNEWGVLTPINNPSALLGSKTRISLGSATAVLQNHSITAMTYWRLKNEDLVVWISRIDVPKEEFQIFYSSDRDERYFPFIEDFASEKWTNKTIDISGFKYEDIIGFHAFKEMGRELQLIVWIRSLPPQLAIYIAGDENKNLDKTHFQYSKSYDDYFCPKPQSSQSSSKAMYYIFAFLIFVLLLCALIIGFMAYNRYKSKEETIEYERIENNEFKDQKQPNQSVVSDSASDSLSDSDKEELNQTNKSKSEPNISAKSDAKSADISSVRSLE